MNDILGNFKLHKSVQAIVGNNTTEGTGVGINVSDRIHIAFGFMLGISADTLSGSVKFEGSLEDSNDSTNGSDGTWGAVAAADIASSTLALVDDPAEDDVIQVVEYKGDKKWVRPKLTFTGTHTNGTPIAIFAISSVRNAPPA